MLQSQDLDLSAVTSGLNSLVNTLNRLDTEESFNSVLATAVQQAKQAGAEETFTLSMTKNLYRYTGRARGLGCEEMSKENI